MARLTAAFRSNCFNTSSPVIPGTTSIFPNFSNSPLTAPRISSGIEFRLPVAKTLCRAMKFISICFRSLFEAKAKSLISPTRVSRFPLSTSISDNIALASLDWLASSSRFLVKIFVSLAKSFCSFCRATAPSVSPAPCFCSIRA